MKAQLGLLDKFEKGIYTGKTPQDLLAAFQNESDVRALEYLLWTRANCTTRLYKNDVNMMLDYIVHNTPVIKLKFPVTIFSAQQALERITAYYDELKQKAEEEERQKAAEKERENRQFQHNQQTYGSQWGSW